MSSANALLLAGIVALPPEESTSPEHQPFAVGDLVLDTLSGEARRIARLLTAGVNSFPVAVALNTPTGIQYRAKTEIRPLASAGDIAAAKREAETQDRALADAGVPEDRHDRRNLRQRILACEWLMGRKG